MLYGDGTVFQGWLKLVVVCRTLDEPAVTGQLIFTLPEASLMDSGTNGLMVTLTTGLVLVAEALATTKP